MDTSKEKKKDKIIVCSKCLRASCFLGIFPCRNYRRAGIIKKSIEELKILNLEDSSYYIRGVKQ